MNIEREDTMNANITDITDLDDDALDALLGYTPDADEVAERIDQVLKDARAARIAYHNYRHACHLRRGGC